ncbi:MAG: VWA domain-containing protein [Thermoanaerobaculia bacterium]|nr:VWA domain-containing protein [Thermoanaerobaculia bacterium]
MTTHRLLIVAAALLAAFFTLSKASVAQDTASGESCRFPADLAERLLAGGLDFGDVPLRAGFLVDEEALLEEGKLRATVEGRMEVGPLRQAPSAELCVFLLLDVDGEALLVHQNRIDFEEFSAVESLRYVLRAELPEGTRRMTFVVRDAVSGLWGAAPMQEPTGSISGPGFSAIRVAEYEGTYYEVTHRAGAPPARSADTTDATGTASSRSDRESRPSDATPRSAGPSASSRAEQIIRIVPPREQPVSGSVTIYTLTSSEAVDAVRFELDGREIDVDQRKPYRARIPFASPPKVQTLRVVALDSRGLPMGEDVASINEIDRPFRVRFTDFAGDPASGSVIVEAKVSVPTGAGLSRVEFWRGEELVKTFTSSGPSYRLDMAIPNAGPDDYLRVAAYLTDGTSIDDVLLLAAPTAVEEVEVNLVEVHVVVTDNLGRPVVDLEPEDFEIVHRGETQNPQSFGYAADVPLVMGLVVDSSGSMQLLMHDTQRAAAKFLGSTLLPNKDQAFLVDFDLQPRLLHPVSGDVVSLMNTLGKLNADGRTAMYDAVVFSLLQFERHVGRRALVILTDGDDLDSRFGPKHVADMARGAGVPVYLIGLGSLDTLFRTYDKSALRKLTGDTGGRLWFVDSFDELADAYAQINAELRSQYTLGFYAEEDLSDEEKRAVKVKVKGRGFDVRAVVGSGAN